MLDNASIGLLSNGQPRPIAERQARASLRALELAGFESRKIQTLSGGQIQRISLARVLLKDPDMIVLDEALTALPVNTRVNIINEIHKKYKGRTCIFVSNFFMLHQVADRILVVDEGRIVEEGTFQELIAKQGYYYDLNNPGTSKNDSNREVL